MRNCEDFYLNLYNRVNSISGKTHLHGGMCFASVKVRFQRANLDDLMFLFVFQVI